MACLLYPDAVLQAQNELDEVVGSNRPPEFSDFPQLPYITAFVNETLRWRPITPAGVPHASSAEDTFMGYRIPEGATIVATYWPLDLDEETFHDPFEFRPERWIVGGDLPFSPFGFGRRACPAQNLARNSLNIVIARILWAFQIGSVCENGHKAKVDP
ncbi:hypothetical protein N7492_004702 [Penicillium capsulatum]|uniref:Cytochrome P450 n=1 Tax=Penicillium capsulatum TaxID=69766 RepID=A0A9W9I851_9EURO|nr:hypothetical protein N7492_004702 [Penicillium capsulatum]